MPRTSPIYYISPQAISIIPNANESPDDLAVYVAKDAKIKICYPPIPQLAMQDAVYQEWTLSGRNRRLADSSCPYTIYARLRKLEGLNSAALISVARSDAYLVFAPQVMVDEQWTDPYILTPNTDAQAPSYTTDADGNRYSWAPIPENQANGNRTNYWWIKLGTVSLPDENGQRIVNLDTGILGTDQYNTDWYLQPDALPLRVDLSCKVDNKEVGTNAHVMWDNVLTLSAHLIRGWDGNADALVRRWTIVRNTGDNVSDASWNNQDEAGSGAREMYDGQIVLSHTRNQDDFDGAPAATYTVTAWGVSDEDATQLVQLAVGVITITAESRDSYTVDLSSYVDMIIVDDTGNVIGGLWTDETYTAPDGNQQTTRSYRISSGITVKRGDDILTMAQDGQEAGPGTYKIGAAPRGCTCSVENSVLVITGIENVKDGVAGTQDDTDFDYDAMRLMDSCMVRLVIDCEGVTSISRDVPISIKHDSQPFVGADLENEHSGVSWNEKMSSFIGLPVDIPLRMWHNDEDLKITGLSIKIGNITRRYARGLTQFRETPFTPLIVSAVDEDLFPYGLHISTTDEVVNGVKRPVLHVDEANSTLPNQTDIIITVSATYAGINYERTLMHTLTRVSDLNVYSLQITPPTIHRKKGQDDNEQTVVAAIMGDSSDDGKYELTASQAGNKKLSVMCRLLTASQNASQLIAQAAKYTTETEWTDAGWKRSNSATTNASTTSVLFALLQDEKLYALETEEVPVMQDGDDGTDVEFVFYAPEGNGKTPNPPVLCYSTSRSSYNPNSEVVKAIIASADYQSGEFFPYVQAASGQNTVRWNDEPTGVAANRTFEYYAKREKVDGTWGPFSDVLVWSHYATDGKDAVVLDLDNENSFVQALTDGTVVGTPETTKVSVMVGGVDMSAHFSFSIDMDATQGCTASIEASTRIVTPANLSNDKNVEQMVVVVIAEPKTTGAYTDYKDSNIILRTNYYIRKKYATAIYSLQVSQPAIYLNPDGTLKDQMVVLSVVKSELGNRTMLTTVQQLAAIGMAVKAGGMALSSLLLNKAAIESLLGSSDRIAFELFDQHDSGVDDDEMWDVETLYTIQDGTNGETTVVQGQRVLDVTAFARTDKDISGTSPTGGSYSGNHWPAYQTVGGETIAWSDGIPAGTGTLWSTRRIFTSDGESPQNEWSSPGRVGDTEHYDVEFSPWQVTSVPQSPDDAPSWWYDPSTGKRHDGVQPSSIDWTSMNWRAERVKVNGTWSTWVITQIKGEKGDEGDSWFKSTVFCRTNVTPDAPDPNYGSYSAPSPDENNNKWQVKSGGVDITDVKWHDGIPAGTAKLWASSRSFCSDGSKSDTTWSTPRPMTDTDTLDIEFSPNETEPNVPAGTTPPTGNSKITDDGYGSRANGSGQQADWYDPTKDAANTHADWTKMIWRAERKISNGAYDGGWVVSRIYGEQGDDAVTYSITANRSLVFDCDADGKIIGSGAIILNAWKRTGNGEPEPFSCFFKRTSNINTVMESSASTSASYTLTNSVAYTMFLVEIYAKATDITPLAQISFTFSKRGAAGKSIVGPIGLRGLIIRITEWETGKQYRNDEDETASDADRYLDIVTISKDKNGDFWNQATRLEAFAFKCLRTHTSTAALRPLDSDDQAINTDYWQPFSSMGPITTPLLWAARAMIEYLSVNEITIMDGQTVKGGIGNGAFPIWFGNQQMGYSFVLTNEGKAYFGSYETYEDSEGNIHAAGQRIVIDPTAKTIRIYDSNGVLVTELSGAKYHSVSGADTSIYTGESAGTAVVSLPTEEDLLDGNIHELLPMTDVNDITHPSLGAGRTVAIELSGLLRLDHCAVRIGLATTDTVPNYFWHKTIGNTGTVFNASLKNLGPIKLPAGHDYVLIVKANDSIEASALTLWNGRVSWKADEYKAHYFGNGFTVGSNSENHLSVYNANVGDEHHQRMNVVAMNDVGGFAMDAQGNSDYIFGHRVPRPVVLCAGYVDTNGNFGGRSWNGNTNHDVFASSTGQTATNITKNGALYRLPLANLRHDAMGNYLPVDPGFNIAWFVSVQAVGTFSSSPDSHPVACIEYITNTELCIRTKRGGNDAAYPFWIKIEYMLHFGS